MPSLISQMQNGIPPMYPQQQQQQITSNSIQQIKQLMHQVQMSNNWQQAVQSYVMQNPKLKGIMGLLNSNGNWQQIAQMMAQQTGTDLKQLIQELQS